MNKLLPLLLAGALRAAAQASDTPAELVRAGLELYAGGKYDAALARYQQALRLAPTDVPARAELARTYNTLGYHGEATALCQQLIKENPLVGPSVYVLLGNSLDASHKAAEALAAYREGIRQFPSNGNLYYQEALNLTSQSKLAEATEMAQRAVRLSPRLAGAHRLLGTVQLQQNRRVPGLLALARFLVLEPNGERSPEQRQLLDQALAMRSTPADSLHLAGSFSAGGLLGRKRKSKPDDFSKEEASLALLVPADLGKSSLARSPIERFVVRFQALCRLLAEQQAKGNLNGFTRGYYVPYFVALEKKGFVPAFSYLAHSSQADAPEVRQWLAAHPNEVQVFQEWSKNYEWK